MPLFDLIFGAMFIGLWTFLGVLPWLTLSIITRGHAGIGLLPLCMLAGVAGGMIVPFLGFTDVTGIWLSFAVALLLPSGLLAARRLAATARVIDPPPADATPEAPPSPRTQ